MQSYLSMTSPMAAAAAERQVGSHTHALGKGSLWDATTCANPHVAFKVGLRMTYRKTFQCAPPIYPPPSTTSQWDMPFHTLQKLNWTRWRIYGTWLILQLETTNPVAFWINYKIVSLSTALVSTLQTVNCSWSDLQPGKIIPTEPRAAAEHGWPTTFLFVAVPSTLWALFGGVSFRRVHRGLQGYKLSSLLKPHRNKRQCLKRKLDLYSWHSFKG